jgi:hypothetical protein
VNVYECKCHDVMSRANECSNTYLKPYSLGNDSNLLCRLFFGVSALTFRYKPPLGASSPFTSAESALTFRCKPPLGASSPFTSAESVLTFRCKLCIPLGTTFELLRDSFSFFFALDGALSAFTFTSLGDFALIELKIKKRNYMLWPH